MDKKKCTKCNTVKPVNQFGVRTRASGKTYPRNHCRDCEAAYASKYRKVYKDKWLKTKRAWYAKHPEERTYTKWRSFARKNGIDPNAVIKYIKWHPNQCDICSKPSKDGKSLHVDHCHDTNDIRGMLCDNCNKALGMFQSNTGIMKSAIEYLKNAPMFKAGSV